MFYTRVLASISLFDMIECKFVFRMFNEPEPQVKLHTIEIILLLALPNNSDSIQIQPTDQACVTLLRTLLIKP